jgi:TonB family protein
MEHPQIARIERRTNVIGGIISAMVAALLLLMCYFLQNIGASERGQNGSAHEYEVVGAIDFGDMQEGSGTINSFDATAENAQQARDMAQASRAIEEEKATTLAQTTTSPVSTPTKEATAKQQASPASAKTANNTSGATAQNQPAQTTSGRNLSGADHGNTDDGVGNAGTSSVKKLDPNGQYTFAADAGSNGLQGRVPIELPYPEYAVQEEGSVKFEFVIKANGVVEYVKVAGLTNKPGLRQAGYEAIRKWRFTPIPANKPQIDQIVQVTIQFKLKG